jgi:hypothetical protein
MTYTEITEIRDLSDVELDAVSGGGGHKHVDVDVGEIAANFSNIEDSHLNHVTIVQMASA